MSFKFIAFEVLSIFKAWNVFNLIWLHLILWHNEQHYTIIILKFRYVSYYLLGLLWPCINFQCIFFTSVSSYFEKVCYKCRLYFIPRLINDSLSSILRPFCWGINKLLETTKKPNLTFLGSTLNCVFCIPMNCTYSKSNNLKHIHFCHFKSFWRLLMAPLLICKTFGKSFNLLDYWFCKV
jgi:hypothetical protein